MKKRNEREEKYKSDFFLTDGLETWTTYSVAAMEQWEYEWGRENQVGNKL